MIRDGLISYRNLQSPILFSESQNATFNTLAIGFVTTLLSFQASALIFDLLLGLKRRNQARICDLHTLLLIRKSSPIIVLNNLLRKDWLTRIYYKGAIPKGTKISRDGQSVKARVVVKLFFLLAAAPVINTLSIAVTMENERKLTFREADFGGLAFGVNRNLREMGSYQFTEDCEQHNTSAATGDEVLVHFSTCAEHFSKSPVPEKFPVPKKSGAVSVGYDGEYFLFVMVVIHEWAFFGVTRAELYANKRVHLVKHDITSRDVAPLVNMGIGLLKAECGVVNASAAEEYHQLSEVQSVKFVYSKKIPCPPIGDTIDDMGIERKALRIMQKLQGYLTFVEADRFDVFLEGSNTKSFSGYDLPALNRRRRIFSLSLLSVLTVILATTRILFMFTCNHDVSSGVEQIVKGKLRFQYCESMLQRGTGKIVYNNKLQSGDCAHYGLPRDDMPRVEKIDGGIVGAKLENETWEQEYFDRDDEVRLD